MAAGRGPPTQKERMLAGEPYRFEGEELARDAQRAVRLCAEYNATGAGEDVRRHALLRQLLGAVGEGVVIRPPFRCDYGRQIRIGDATFANFGLVILDVVAVTIGRNCQIGPNVQILPADHPRDPARRRAGWESGRAITIGDNVWLGGGAIILPGVSIGDDAIIGAGSVVTRDVPPGATVAGNPARRLSKTETPR